MTFSIERRLKILERDAPSPEDTHFKEMEAILGQLTADELLIVETMPDDRDRRTPAQQAVLQWLETLMAEQHG